MIVGGFGASIVTARALGPTGRGDYAFVATLGATVVQMGNLGLHSSNTYIVAQRREALRALLANSVWVSLVLGVGGGLAAVGLLTWTSLFPQTPSSYMWFVVALAPPALFFLFGANLLIGVGEVLTFNVYEAGSAFVALLALGGAAIAGVGVAGFLAASVAAWWVVAALLLLKLHRLAGGTGGFDVAIFRSGLRFAAKAYLVALLGFLVLRSHYFLLARLSGAKEIGYFSVAAQLSDVLALVPTSAALVLFPNLVQNRAGSWAATVRMAGVVGASLVVLCVVAGALAPPFIHLAFGGDYGPAVPTVRWMLPGVLALGVTTVLSQHVAAMGMPKQIIGIWIFGLLSVVALGRVLIPRYGAVGAGAAYSVAYAALLVLVFCFAYRLRNVARPAAKPAEADALA
jgi:O-antigen/teichoic acid export membrane protein